MKHADIRFNDHSVALKFVASSGSLVLVAKDLISILINNSVNVSDIIKSDVSIKLFQCFNNSSIVFLLVILFMFRFNVPVFEFIKLLSP